MLLLGMVAIPAAVALKTYAMSLPTSTPPSKARSAHPEPPSTITVQTPGMEEGHVFNVINDANPFRRDEVVGLQDNDTIQVARAEVGFESAQRTCKQVARVEHCSRIAVDLQPRHPQHGRDRQDHRKAGEPPPSPGEEIS